MTTYLLDANILIALGLQDHPDRDRAAAWAGTLTLFAVCPITEGALVRALTRAGHIAAARPYLRALAKRHGYEFWPDDLSYTDADLSQVMGHKQVTDAYLVALTRRHEDAKLATMDVALAASYPDVAELIPDVPPVA